ncbi:AIR synthase-related protein [Halovenus rubra]|uniref:AIR synthase-related protein n=2 Tax=Halovenus rubra TaxID=869890 RepID=A0ABD5XCX2_9EURY|nr:AIR synthase-related protein [Halovenus rubra]
MPDTGKIDRTFFETVIASRLGATRQDVTKGPAHGVDFGVIDVGDAALALATDPISILPEIGLERAGRFAIRFLLTDVAVSGLAPSHLAVSFSLPPGMTDEEFESVWKAIDRECTDLGISIVTGHTARYEECSLPWVGHGTIMAAGNHEDIIYPDGARPGDVLLVTKGPAVESVGLLTTLFPDLVSLDESTLDTAQSLLDEAKATRDAMAVADTGGVRAMHDATEGGLVGAFHEMAGSAGVQFRIDTDAIPVQPGVRQGADALGLDIWHATSSGTLVIAVQEEKTEAVIETLEARGTSVGIAGRVTDGDGVVLDGSPTDPPSGDASWPVYERLLDEQAEQ